MGGLTHSEWSPSIDAAEGIAEQPLQSPCIFMLTTRTFSCRDFKPYHSCSGASIYDVSTGGVLEKNAKERSELREVAWKCGQWGRNQNNYIFSRGLHKWKAPYMNVTIWINGFKGKRVNKPFYKWKVRNLTTTQTYAVPSPTKVTSIRSVLLLCRHICSWIGVDAMWTSLMCASLMFDKCSDIQ